jgi:hypothetical protein
MVAKPNTLDYKVLSSFFLLPSSTSVLELFPAGRQPHYILPLTPCFGAEEMWIIFLGPLLFYLALHARWPWD